MIMSDNVTIIRQRQRTIRNQLDKRGIALKAVAFDSDIPYPTLLSYFPEPGGRDPAQIPGSAIFALCGVLPPDLLSLLVPDGFQIVRAPELIDHDALCELAQDYVATKMKAHRPDSPGGVAIVPEEEDVLNGKVLQFARVA
jgi:hypothetical protein